MDRRWPGRQYWLVSCQGNRVKAAANTKMRTAAGRVQGDTIIAGRLVSASATRLSNDHVASIQPRT